MTYCISVESGDPAQLVEIRAAIEESSAVGLLPLKKRFHPDPSLEPLVAAAFVDARGRLQNWSVPWMPLAFMEAYEPHRLRQPPGTDST